LFVSRRTPRTDDVERRDAEQEEGDGPDEADGERVRRYDGGRLRDGVHGAVSRAEGDSV
jgi:hypothetical protein